MNKGKEESIVQLAEDFFKGSNRFALIYEATRGHVPDIPDCGMLRFSTDTISLFEIEEDAIADGIEDLPLIHISFMYKPDEDEPKKYFYAGDLICMEEIGCFLEYLKKNYD